VWLGGIGLAILHFVLGRELADVMTLAGAAED
jgi:hypothetical protein